MSLRLLLGIGAVLVLGCSERAEKAGDAAPVVLPSATPAPSAAPSPSAEVAAPDAGALEPREKADRIVLLAGGDVALGRGLGQKIIAEPTYDPFSEMAPLFKTADFRMVNLESQLSDQKGVTVSKENWLVFTGPPGGADVLARANINLVSLANNHAWDFQKRGFLETLANLERVGIPYAGARREPNRQYEPTIVMVKGWRVAVFGVTHIWNQGPIQNHEGRFYVAWAAFDALEHQLKKARKENDLVIIQYHGGGEYIDVPMQWTREFINAVMKAGVDVVIGHHPHVPHGIAWHGDRPAFYSLGNFVFAMHSDYPWTGTSFMARMTFNRDGRHQFEACPYHIFAGIPLPFEGKTKAARERSFASHLKQISVTTRGTEIGEPGELSCMALAPPNRAGSKKAL